MKHTLTIIAVACTLLFAGSISAQAIETSSLGLSVRKDKEKAWKTAVFNVSMHCEKCVKK